MTYQPTLQSLREHPVPEWYQNAKLGIFIHWGLYSVPAWAPTGYSIIDLLKQMSRGETKVYESPYAEWYQNNIKLQGSQSRNYHEKAYGAGFAYENFSATFNEEIKKWDPGEWASLLKEIGARYVVLTTKHHDGFLLWPSRQPNPFKPNYFASRDIVGELTSAVRNQGLHMGLYYSGGLDWTFNPAPIKQIADLFLSVPQSADYIRYCMGHWRELIERYQPEVLWNDIGMPNKAKVEELFAEYYNRFPEGVVNDRFLKGLGPLTKLFRPKPLRKWLSRMMMSVLTNDKPSTLERRGHCDYVTPEYTTYRDVESRKWESTRGIGRSFGFNQNEQEQDYIAIPDLVHQFIDVVSKNGNLLLNIGPLPDGSISPLQLRRVKGLGNWLKLNGEGIFDTRPWLRAEGTAQETAGEVPIRFTQKDENLYAFLLNTPKGPSIRLQGLKAAEGTQVNLLGDPEALEWRQAENDLLVIIDERVDKITNEGNAVGLHITPKPEDIERESI
jgi:alpha-L-fucosidase